MRKYILAIDQGTSSTRAMIYDLDGHLLDGFSSAITSYYPEPGWVEHCPEEIWTKTLHALSIMCTKYDARKIIAAGITNQRETTVVWNKKTGECLYRAIVWQDTRTQDFCQLHHEKEELIRYKTGLFLNPYFSATKLNWILTHIDKARILAEQNALAFGTIDSFLLWRLTNGAVHATDTTNASRTLLLNIHTGLWDAELLKFFTIPPQIMPQLHASNAHFGYIDKKHTGTVPIPILGIAGDQQAALIGQQCFAEGQVKATFGTGGFLLMNTGNSAKLSTNKLLTTIAYQFKEQRSYALEGSLYHAGTIVKWLRDGLGIIKNAADSGKMAASIPSNEGVYLVPAFNGLGAPYWINKTGAMIYGLRQTTQPSHIIRAALESVAYMTREVLAAMQQDSGISIDVVRVDGGMAANDWFLQFLANQCSVVVQRPADIESTARGAAILALLGSAEMDAKLLASFASMDKEFFPDGNREQRAQDFYGWKRAIVAFMGDAYSDDSFN